jgi:AAA domain-containing protein
MSKFTFSKASRKQARARVAIVGPAGSGKTMTSLILATNLGERVAFIDTEHGSASKYAPKDGEAADGVNTFSFDVLALDSYSPSTYTEAIQAAESEGFDAIVIDSLSHAWMGKDGALEQADKASARGGENRFTAWRHVTPQHNGLIESLVGCRAHLIATMRSKTEYVIEENEKGKKVPRKIGMAPVQRDGMEYEFDLVADMDHDHRFVVSKSRCPALADAVIHKPGPALAEQLRAWLSDGSPMPPSEAQKIVVEAAAVANPKALADLKERARGIYKRATETERQALDRAIKDATEVLGARLEADQAQAAS